MYDLFSGEILEETSTSLPYHSIAHAIALSDCFALLHGDDKERTGMFVELWCLRKKKRLWRQQLWRGHPGCVNEAVLCVTLVTEANGNIKCICGTERGVLLAISSERCAD